MARNPSFTYDRRLGRYRDARGRLVSDKAVRRELDYVLGQMDNDAKRLAEDYRAGRISLNSWRIEMRRLIKDSHNFAAMAAKGGHGEMTPRDWGKVGAIVKREYGFLEHFTQQLQRQEIPADGHFLQRTTLYTQAPRETFHETEREVMRERGRDEVRNVLHPADHCEGPGSCIEQSGFGWQPIDADTISPPGTRLCGRRCKCTLEYRRAA